MNYANDAYGLTTEEASHYGTHDQEPVASRDVIVKPEDGDARHVQEQYTNDGTTQDWCATIPVRELEKASCTIPG